MPMIHDTDGNELGDILLTTAQQTLLDAEQNVAVLYHTPQLLQGTLGKNSGSFTLFKDGDRILVLGKEAFQEFLTIQAGVKALKANEQPPQRMVPEPPHAAPPRTEEEDIAAGSGSVG
jgi:hypothetical protein